MKQLLIVLLFLSSCSFKKDPSGNQTESGHEELYSEPDAPKLEELDPGIKRIVIAATNDIEGNYSPSTINVNDEHNDKKLKIKIGGKEAAATYFQILRDTFKNVVLVDSGDIFSSKLSIKEVQGYYAENKYDAVTVGLGDFNVKLPSGIKSNTELFREFARTSDTPLVLSNLYELKTARTVEWKGTAPYLIKEIDGVKVGIIGLVPDDVTKLTPVDNRVGLYVENMIQSTLRQARLLRSLNADLIVVLTHLGMPCGHEQAQEKRLPLKKVNFHPREQGICDLSSALGTYLERLPPGLVDVVVGGRHHEKMANFVKDMVVLSGPERGQGMIYAEFLVDTKKNKVLKDKIEVHQPVLFCHEFFKETDDCWPHDQTVDHKKRKEAKFLGQPIKLGGEASPTAGKSRVGEPDVKSAMVLFGSDIVFLPKSSRESQLINVQVSGMDLITILEEEYNKGQESKWFPSPYSLRKGLLHLHVKGKEISPTSTYAVLADLEAVQANRFLRKTVLQPMTRVFMEHSWDSFTDADELRTKMAARLR